MKGDDRMSQQLPGGGAGRELAKTLQSGEQVLSYATGKGGALLVATDRRAIVIKAGPRATGTWFGKKNASFGYQQITSVDLHTGIMDGYVEVSAGGVQNRNVGRTAQLIDADNICPFNKWDEGSFRQVVEVIRHHLYRPSGQSSAPGASVAQSIPDQIGALAQLRDAGVLTSAEFDAKEVELLSRM